MNDFERQRLIDDFIDGYEKLQRALKKSYFEALGDSSTSPAQIVILFLLERNGRLNGREIAAHIHITKSAVSQLVDALEYDGFIARAPNLADRRIVYLELTDKGRKKVRLLHKKRKELLSDVSAVLTTDELALMTAIHEKMRCQLEDK